jgi:hypothetical protein
MTEEGHVDGEESSERESLSIVAPYNGVSGSVVGAVTAATFLAGYADDI